MKRPRAFLLVLLLFVVACAQKREPLPGDSVSADGAVTLSPPRLSSSPASASPAEGPIETRLYPPELAMERQIELGITEEQKKALITESERGHSEVLKYQWELEAEKEKLVKLLEPDTVDEAKVKDAAARVMDRETKVKAAYLTMLVRVKNVLTPEQKTKLRELRAQQARGDAGR
ncbi:MAG: periplasmic heavy metal sensor [Labilithrix sp.]|nr:periplasmic heavy metal sensor [Labilithrix sp.]MCW5815379.1 periplasmic heavy metal sensor [Labilithrix sp.]